MTLLAKSTRLGQAPTLAEHTEHVVRAFKKMFGTCTTPSRFGRCWQRFFGVDDWGLFFRCGVAGAVLHDCGKANDGFQAAVSAGGRQLIRHEHLSALLMNLDTVQKWLRQRSDIDWDVVLASVLCHHLKANHNNLAEYPPEGTQIMIPIADCDFQAYLGTVGRQLGLSGPVPEIAPCWRFDQESFGIETQRQKLQDRLQAFRKALRRAEARLRLLIAVRAGLIAVDAVGSAMPRVGMSIENWIESVLNEVQVCRTSDIWEMVVEPRIAQLRQLGRWNDAEGINGWNLFQVACEDLPSRSLLLAPCGAGKTLAAWRWIARQCHNGIKRVIFLYPTRATATEGFRDYVSWAPEDDGALMHGAAEYDLQGMFENPDDEADRRRDKDFQVNPHLYALAFWSRRIFSATVDQFFSFLHYEYASMCLLPLLVDSVVVVDEVHSFDRPMFSALKQFLMNFNVPVLCMTATLPIVRRDELQNECGLRIYEEKPGQLATIAGALRYRVRVATEGECASRVAAAVSEGKRVLWVVNRVKQAQKVARAFADRAPVDSFALRVIPDVSLYCYHSRFKLEDRRNRHLEVVRAFQGSGSAVLAITTQVCEMSLDLDADVLVTESAPITALIQRMGRCNRQSTPRPTAGEVWIYKSEEDKPYDAIDLTGVDSFLSEVTATERVSQLDLEGALRKHGPSVPDVPQECNFLTSGPYAMSGESSFRDIDEFTVPAILERDVSIAVDLLRKKQPIAGYVVPVPRRYARTRHESLPRYLSIAPNDHYHAALGFCDEPLRSEGGNS